MPGVPFPRTEDNIHYLTHWIWQISLNWFRSLHKAQCTECFEDGQGTSNVQQYGQFHRPGPSLSTELSGVAPRGRKSPVASARWVWIWKLYQPQIVWNGWQHLPSLCLSFLIFELEVMSLGSLDGMVNASIIAFYHFLLPCSATAPTLPPYFLKDHRDFSLLLDNVCLFIR